MKFNTNLTIFNRDFSLNCEFKYTKTKTSEKSSQITVKNNQFQTICLLFKEKELYLRRINNDFWIPVILESVNISNLEELIKKIDSETCLSKTCVLDYERFILSEENDYNSNILCYILNLRPGEIVESKSFEWKQFSKDLLEEIALKPELEGIIKKEFSKKSLLLK